MKKKVFHQMCGLVLVTLLLSMAMVSFVFYNQLKEDIHRELSSGTAYIKTGLEAEGVDYLLAIEGQHKDSRITLVGADGDVIFDSEVDLSKLNNHKDRPEIKEALQTGVGEAVRMSDTIGRQTYYYAEKLSDGTVLRLSSTTDNVLATLMKSVPFLLGIIFFVLCLALLLANYQTKRFLEPINALDLEHPMENDSYDELSPLLLRIHQQHQRIEEQIAELGQRQQEFKAITDNMKEGLILIDAEGLILSVNQSALALFHGGSSVTEGRHISNLNRDSGLQKAVDSALAGVTAEEILSLGSKLFQLHANPVFEQSRIKGAVLLLLDVTKERESEKMRREFSANVSHELKTPLTAISGFAELLRDGLVKQEDIASFGGKIFEEAARLIALINDIIKLSELDENDVLLPKERMDLRETAEAVLSRLEPLAKKNGITLRMEAEVTWINGVPRLLDELIYNLCENAIKYNRKNGSVFIKLRPEGKQAVLSVEDTGLGIPEEEIGRIFERFYRVDKSHSKETGGTGLGLSIAKHIAAYHGGELLCKSIFGEGTVMTARFPLF
ncbi:MAG: ATP-binding protein [Eubacteriales bacterium]|nr:ATP-binding protein [Eubacteriales bacterium]